MIAAEPTTPPPEETAPKNEDVSLSDNQKRVIGFGLGSIALGTGAALGAWLDRDGTFGRVSAIVAGTLGSALAIAGISALITSFIFPKSTRTGYLEEAVEDTGRTLMVGVVAIVAGLAGLIAGGVMSGFVSAPPGTQRGVLGIAGGGAMAVTSIVSIIVALN
jgi:hypothetical protein